MFEDLHWIDAETQALLDGLVEALPTARILLLVNYRPGVHHAGATRATTPSFGSTRSGRPAPRSLLDGLLGAPSTGPEGAALQALKPLLIERTEGNPFFLEESVRALVETGVLIGERGAYHLVRPAEEIRVSATVQTVLAARIDRLAPEDKRLLQTAAVVGKDVPFACWTRSPPSEADLRAALAWPSRPSCSTR